MRDIKSHYSSIHFLPNSPPSSTAPGNSIGRLCSCSGPVHVLLGDQEEIILLCPVSLIQSLALGLPIVFEEQSLSSRTILSKSSISYGPGGVGGDLVPGTMVSTTCFISAASFSSLQTENWIQQKSIQEGYSSWIMEIISRGGKERFYYWILVLMSKEHGFISEKNFRHYLTQHSPLKDEGAESPELNGRSQVTQQVESPAEGCCFPDP